jgi:hypothetical protein
MSMAPMLDPQCRGRVRTHRTSEGIALAIAPQGLGRSQLKKLLVGSGWVLFPLVFLLRIQITPIVVVASVCVFLIGVRLLYAVIMSSFTEVQIWANSSDVRIHVAAKLRTNQWAETVWTGRPDQVAVELSAPDLSFGRTAVDLDQRDVLLKYDGVEMTLAEGLSVPERELVVNALRPFVYVTPSTHPHDPPPSPPPA